MRLASIELRISAGERSAISSRLPLPSPAPRVAQAVGSVGAPRSTASRIFRASSIAMLGTGGAPFLTTFAAISPASAPSSSEDHGHREEAPEVREVAHRQVEVEQPRAPDQHEHQRRQEEHARGDPNDRALGSLVAFSLTSAFASSISSRTATSRGRRSPQSPSRCSAARPALGAVRSLARRRWVRLAHSGGSSPTRAARRCGSAVWRRCSPARRQPATGPTRSVA